MANSSEYVTSIAKQRFICRWMNKRVFFPGNNAKNLVLSDSIAKYIHQYFENPDKITVCCYRGINLKKLKEIMEYIPIKGSYEKVIIHAGTNDLFTRSDKGIIDDTMQLITTIKRIYPNARIFLSSILIREGVKRDYLSQLNHSLKESAAKENVSYIDTYNSIFMSSHLATDRLHLNRRGSACLSYKFEKVLKN